MVVEVPVARTVWRSRGLSRAVGIRDSKAPDAGHLALPVGDFAHLVARVKRDAVPSGRE